MTTVAIPAGTPGRPDRYHEVDAEGVPQCHVGRREDREYELVERETLDASVEPCRICTGDGEIYRGGGDGWAAKLRSADDPEEVLQS
ncbi:MAG: hypothetical protein ACOCV2_15030 [Persicimonas sp.]